MPATPTDNFHEVFAALKALIQPLEESLTVTSDTPDNYTTVMRSKNYKGKPLYFASVLRKSYVAFHLFPVYMNPKLQKMISPALKKRMQGKTCWNFKKTDPALFAELAVVVEEGLRCVERGEFPPPSLH